MTPQATNSKQTSQIRHSLWEVSEFFPLLQSVQDSNIGNLPGNRKLYFDGWIHEIGTSLECEGCLELKNRIEALAVKIFIGLCVPEICNRDEIREELAPSSLDVNLEDCGIVLIFSYATSTSLFFAL